MPKLTVNEFSCISHAAIDLSRMTVLIGPQGSGKSVLSKLLYFFQFVLSDAHETPNTIVSSIELKEFINDNFRRWFPESAWGNSRFYIHYESGPISITIHRDRPYKVQRNSFQITLSRQYEKIWRDLQADYRELISSRVDQGVSITRRMDFRLSFQISGQYTSLLKTSLGSEFVDDQLFIPAGRSFFTSIGKAIAVFEHSNSLDPVTLMFGRMWGSIKDSRYESYAEIDHNMRRMQSVFGGTVSVEKDQEFILADDGRKIPFSSLSSGQQELLPLWMATDSFFAYTPRDHTGSVLYIEEPEAHLFPAAQSEIVEYLVCKLVSDQVRRSMVLTTHSPYVLSKLNNLILAGRIASNGKSAATKVRRIVDKSSWLPPGWVQAYAIENGVVTPIIDKDGLIDAGYLDRISGDIVDQFDQLVEVEASL